MSEAVMVKKADNGKSAKDKVSEKAPEPKDVKFRRLALRRVPAAIKRIRHVANLATRSQYQYTDEQANKIIQVIRDEVKAMENAFAGRKQEVETFTL